MGDKAAARKLMAESGVPVLPGCDQDIRDDQRLLEEAVRIGFPLSGQSRGRWRRQRHAGSTRAKREFIEALHAARREAKAAFGDDRVLLERYLSNARHIEVQVFADQHGHTLHLFERDCSVQRRHQKIIEEAPAPGLTEAQRTAVGEAAVQAAKAIDYVGAGTVEFLFADGHFYFMEMNTRLQVEHPVTEMITGEDLVWWQLCVAAGQPLPKQQHELCIHGAAMEVRIYAEDPWQNFMPSSGLLRTLVWPHEEARVDSGYEQGDRVESFYDPMIAKIICHGESRDAARQQLMQALSATLIDGIHHNCGFLYQVLGSAAFASANLDTRLLEQHPQLMEKPAPQRELTALAAAIVLTDEQPGGDPWQSLNGWRPFATQLQQHELMTAGDSVLVQIESDRRQRSATINGQQRSLHWYKQTRQLSLAWGSDTLKARFVRTDNGVVMNIDGESSSLQSADSNRGQQQHDSRHAPFAAPMSGNVVAVHIQPGTWVKAGSAVITMEAMKMEHTLRAPADGIVTALLASIGEQVSEGTVLAEFTASEAEQP
jgi:3-methylcrotonyl-CoA carboxylase alpha subunit